MLNPRAIAQSACVWEEERKRNGLSGRSGHLCQGVASCPRPRPPSYLKGTGIRAKKCYFSCVIGIHEDPICRRLWRQWHKTCGLFHTKNSSEISLEITSILCYKTLQNIPCLEYANTEYLKWNFRMSSFIINNKQVHKIFWCVAISLTIYFCFAENSCFHWLKLHCAADNYKTKHFMDSIFVYDETTHSNVYSEIFGVHIVLAQNILQSFS